MFILQRRMSSVAALKSKITDSELNASMSDLTTLLDDVSRISVVASKTNYVPNSTKVAPLIPMPATNVELSVMIA